MSKNQDRPSPIELKWIDEPAYQNRPLPDEFGPPSMDRTFSSVFLKKAKENVFVPIGLMATVACLTLGLVNLRKGDSKKQQIFMRGRVTFQGLTLGAMVFGAMLARSGKSTNE